jgi:ubiquinone/menaquinone biosynthesis C-methylase UbiE
MSYLSRERWISFWYQLLEVMETKPGSILEVGLGPGILTRTLRDMEVKVVTLDIEIKLKPDVTGDVSRIPFQSKSFDTVLAAEVLEHIPFDQFPIALKELARVAKQTVVITLPHFTHFVPSIALKVFPFVPRLKKVFPITFPKSHEFDGQHYWEIGKRNYSVSRVRGLLKESTGFKLIKDYLIEENPYHHVFVLTSKK